MTTRKKGMTAEIYRSHFSMNDPSNVLNNFKKVTILDDAIPEMWEPEVQSPAVRIVRRVIFGNPYIHAEPIQPGQYMFGGCYITSSDSRIKELNQYPIPLHDRVE